MQGSNWDKFEMAYFRAMEFEGGYVNDPDDPGGETKFGLSKKTYPELDIGALTHAKAMDIYYKDWWEPNSYGSIKNLPLAIKMFDTAINVGAKRANKWLQRAINHLMPMSGGKNGQIEVDGVIGPKTLEALACVPGDKVLEIIQQSQLSHYEKIINKNPVMAKYKNGWEKRARA